MRILASAERKFDTIPNSVRFSICVFLFFIALYSPMTLTYAGLPQASISWSPNVLSASTVAGSNAPAQSFNVWNSGGGTLSYSIAVDESWLSCFPASGTSTGEHDSITVSCSTASLSLGTYSATITISDPGADNSPRSIPVTLTVTSFPQAIMELNFEEGEGTTAYDTSGNNNNGTLDGGVVYTKDRAVGSYALALDGTDDRVACPGNSSLRPDDISVALWIEHAKDTSSSNPGGIIQGAYGTGYRNGFRILDYQNRPLAQINFGDAEPIEILGTVLILNEWSHVVVTYDHRKIRLYQNGQLVVERRETRNINWTSIAGDLSIGLAQWYFNGLIDKVMIFSSPLTTQMVQQLYSENWAFSGRHHRSIQPRTPSENRRQEIRPRRSPPETSISWSPSVLSVFTMAGNNASAQTLNVWNSGGGTLSYSIAVDQGWLSCFPASGTSTGEHDSITVSYSTASLSPGTYSATIIISDMAATNSPQTVPVSLNVTSFPPAIVELNFEEGDGTTAYDSSGNNNNGTLEGGVVYTKDRAVGSHALSFDGTDDRVVCPANLLLRPDDISVSLWVKHSKDTGGGIIQGAYGTGYRTGFRIMDYRDGPFAQINFGNARPIEIIGSAFTMNEWTHLVLTYNHKKIRLYQNGQLVVEQPETRNIKWASSASDLSIGLAQWYFSGLIDKVMIFDSALTTKQVQQLYRDR
jgi:hypothetical protein